MLKSLFGQPAHPVYVHFPVALFLLSSALLFFRVVDGQKHRLNRILKKIGLGNFDFEAFSLLSLFLGVTGGVVAIASGLALVGGWENLPFPHGPLGLATVACYLVLLLLRWVFGTSLYGREGLRLFYYFLHVVGVILVILAGYQGGELHYQ